MRPVPDTNRSAIRRAIWMAVAAAFVPLAAGCAPTVSGRIRRHPAFYDPDLKRLAVLPLKNEALEPRAGRYVTDRLIRELRENGTYDVGRAPAAIADVEANSPGPEADDVLRQLRQKGQTDLLLTGSVLTFDASQTVAYHEYPNTFYGGIGYPYSYFGYRRVIVARPYEVGLAVVELRIRLLRVSDGSTLYLSDRPIRVRLRDTSHPVKVPEERLREATDRAIDEVLETIAVVETEFEIESAATMAVERVRDGERRTADDFRDEDELMVTVRLPAEAGYNRFRLEIRPEKPGQPVAARSFIWDRDQENREFSFDPAGWVQPGEGAEFDVVLLRGEQVVASEDIEVKRHSRPSDR